MPLLSSFSFSSALLVAIGRSDDSYIGVGIGGGGGGDGGEGVGSGTTICGISKAIGVDMDVVGTDVVDTDTV